MLKWCMQQLLVYIIISLIPPPGEVVMLKEHNFYLLLELCYCWHQSSQYTHLKGIVGTLEKSLFSVMNDFSVSSSIQE